MVGDLSFPPLLYISKYVRTFTCVGLVSADTFRKYLPQTLLRTLKAARGRERKSDGPDPLSPSLTARAKGPIKIGRRPESQRGGEEAEEAEEEHLAQVGGCQLRSFRGRQPCNSERVIAVAVNQGQL